MSYATPTDLLNRADLQEVLQNLQRNHPALTEDALRDAVAGNDLVGYDAEVSAAAEKALERLNVLLADASAVVDSFCDGPYTIPLNPVPARIPGDVCTLALYQLYGAAAREGDSVAMDYRATIDWLKMVAKRAVKTGVDSTDTQAESYDLPVVQTYIDDWSES